MHPPTIAHFCQKCRAPNPLGQEFCARCGTRLMLVVEPPAMKHDAAEATTVHEEHLLERLSILENRLARLTERLEKGLSLLLRQSENTYATHTLVKTLVDALAEAGSINSAELERNWRERCDREAAGSAAKE
jgi:zinc ribbon protein